MAACALRTSSLAWIGPMAARAHAAPACAWKPAKLARWALISSSIALASAASSSWPAGGAAGA
eukprot:2462424-Lingulodinium_polyedra.AAC.1